VTSSYRGRNWNAIIFNILAEHRQVNCYSLIGRTFPVERAWHCGPVVVSGVLSLSLSLSLSYGIKYGCRVCVSLLVHFEYASVELSLISREILDILYTYLLYVMNKIVYVTIIKVIN